MAAQHKEVALAAKINALQQQVALQQRHLRAKAAKAAKVPLCAMRRKGWARFQEGKELVEKREWTSGPRTVIGVRAMKKVKRVKS